MTATPNPKSQDPELDALVRDACTIGFYGPKSEYRKRLKAWADRQTIEALETVKIKAYHQDFNGPETHFAEAVDRAIKELKDDSKK